MTKKSQCQFLTPKNKMMAEVNAEISIGQNTTQEDGKDKYYPTIDRKDRLNQVGPSGLQGSRQN